ncbi:MAG: carbonic anhydrase [Acidobacteria bacterium]|nr:carbonic anhydrase [Acidobacteriota bacterium]
MYRILKGIEHFENFVHPSNRELFEELATGQKPETMMITCSDSRVVPSLITQTMPGEIFVLRNAGNLLPEYPEAGGGEWATVEYAVEILKVKHIIVCGHSDCGAIKQVLRGRCPRRVPAVARWLAHARPVKRALARRARTLEPDEVLQFAIRENVLLQLRRLRAHPRIARSIEKGKLSLHGWVFDIGTGSITAYDAGTDRFLKLAPAAAGRAA